MNFSHSVSRNHQIDPVILRAVSAKAADVEMQRQHRGNLLVAAKDAPVTLTVNLVPSVSVKDAEILTGQTG